MDAGQIVEMNTPNEFFKNPQYERTKLFLSQILHWVSASSTSVCVGSSACSRRAMSWRGYRRTYRAFSVRRKEAKWAERVWE